MDVEPSLVGLPRPVLDDVEVAKVDVEAPPVELEDSSPVHHLSPFEGTEHPTRPTQLLERPRVDLSSVVDGKVPIALRTEVPTGPRSTEVHRLRIGEPSAGGNHHLYELTIGHAPIVPASRPVNYAWSMSSGTGFTLGAAGTIPGSAGVRDRGVSQCVTVVWCSGSVRARIESNRF